MNDRSRTSDVSESLLLVWNQSTMQWDSIRGIIINTFGTPGDRHE
jgi:hypothetical protein